MELVNELYDFKAKVIGTDLESSESEKVFGEALRNTVIMLSPFAPHFCDELWEEMGEEGFLFEQSWPTYDEKLMIASEIIIAIQVNGKVRGSVVVERTATKEEIQEQALEVENVKKHIEGKNIVKIIVVPGKIVNIVIK